MTSSRVGGPGAATATARRGPASRGPPPRWGGTRRGCRTSRLAASGRPVEDPEEEGAEALVDRGQQHGHGGEAAVDVPVGDGPAGLVPVGPALVGFGVAVEVGLLGGAGQDDHRRPEQARPAELRPGARPGNVQSQNRPTCSAPSRTRKADPCVCPADGARRAWSRIRSRASGGTGRSSKLRTIRRRRIASRSSIGVSPSADPSTRLAHDVAQDFVGAAGDPHPRHAEHEVGPGVGAPLAGVGDQSGAEHAGQQLRHLLHVVGQGQLERRQLRARAAGRPASWPWPACVV